MTKYILQRCTILEWVPLGEFETKNEAIAAMAEIDAELGWQGDLRVIAVHSNGDWEPVQPEPINEESDMINLTPHAITIFCDGAEITIPPSGKIARVETAEKVAAPCRLHGRDVTVVTRVFGQVTGLPEDGTPCIVSSMVLAAVPGRTNTYAPDTGGTAIRDEGGRILGVTRLVAA